MIIERAYASLNQTCVTCVQTAENLDFFTIKEHHRSNKFPENGNDAFVFLRSVFSYFFYQG